MLPLLKMLINPDYGKTFLIYPTFIGKPIMFVHQPFGNISILLYCIVKLYWPITVDKHDYFSFKQSVMQYFSL
jgi:hypothetical protein